MEVFALLKAAVFENRVALIKVIYSACYTRVYYWYTIIL
jgi:hypothetical protein